jgi:hypothetical protein
MSFLLVEVDALQCVRSERLSRRLTIHIKRTAPHHSPLAIRHYLI